VFTPHPNPTLKGLFVRLTRLALTLACFAAVLATFLHHGTRRESLLSALLTVVLVALVLLRNKILPLTD
jgi:hypothetical protein